MTDAPHPPTGLTAAEADSGNAALLKNLLDKVPPGVVVVFDCSRYDFDGDDKAKIDRVSKFYASLPDTVEFPRYKPEEARSLVQARARELELKIAPSEVEFLVEATGAEDPRQVAAGARDAFGVVVAVTGAIDVIAGAERTYLVHNGSPLLAAITGSGCMATATIGIFNAVGSDPALQTALALATYGLAAERAAGGDPGPGTFRTRLLDEVATARTAGTDGIRITIA